MSSDRHPNGISADACMDIGDLGGFSEACFLNRSSHIISSYNSPAGSGTERGVPLGMAAIEHPLR